MKTLARHVREWLGLADSVARRTQGSFAPFSIVHAATSDSLNALGMVTGLPLGQLGKPLAYAADVATGRAQPEIPVDLIQGALSGRDGTSQQ